MNEVSAGTVMGVYRLQAQVGQGGMGIVYQAESVQTGAVCAVKILPPDMARQPGFRERFQRESRYANSIAHPNIIEVYDAGEEGGILYLAMQYVEGRDLKGVLAEEGPLDAPRAVGLMSQIASALDAAHATGLLHRDIKPGNIMISPSATPGAPEHCYLTDFGLSKNVSSDSIALTAAGEFVGTIDYTAPELVLGKGADYRVDIYSLGCVLYECLAGQVVFPKERDVEVLYAHIQDAPPRVTAARPELPPAIDEVLARALAKSPEDRYESCTAFLDAARAVVGGPPVAATVTRELRLHVAAGNMAGREIAVDQELLIGRHAPGDGRLADDIEISRRHAMIARDAQGCYVIEDLGSTNGTFVNGTRIAGPQVLQPGDVVEVGETTLRVQLPPEAPGVEAPPAGAPADATAFGAAPVGPPPGAAPPVPAPPEPAAPEAGPPPPPPPPPAAEPPTPVPGAQPAAPDPFAPISEPPPADEPPTVERPPAAEPPTPAPAVEPPIPDVPAPPEPAPPEPAPPEPAPAAEAEPAPDTEAPVEPEPAGIGESSDEHAGPPAATVFAPVPPDVIAGDRPAAPEAEPTAEQTPAAATRRVDLALEGISLHLDVTDEGVQAVEIDGTRFVREDGEWRVQP